MAVTFPYIFKKLLSKINITNKSKIEKVNSLLQKKNYKYALLLINELLQRKKNQTNISLILCRAKCYEETGETGLSNNDIELAYSLDDTLVTTIYQRAVVHNNSNQSTEALELFSLVKDQSEVVEGVDTQLSAICMNRGDSENGIKFQLSAWLAEFDNLRQANCYLFRCAYGNHSEEVIAQEHLFWSSTLKLPTIEISKFKNQTTADKKKIRIAYWGCDFRNHSVRYFSRPLIEAHNKEEFDVYIYNENFLRLADDEQTKAFRKATNFFYDTWEMSDQEVLELIISHEIDILVDIAGHTSSNRMHLLKYKLAKVQITGLAYPPTTGLDTIDYKMVDPHIFSDDAERFYTEKPLVLPCSFWCFDPKEDIPYTEHPPFIKNGYITYGCFGNVAKISDSILKAWASVLSNDLTSKLIIQSPTFNDEGTVNSFTNRVYEFGISSERLTIKKPVFGLDFWREYFNVDIILDTYPFNGGTTSSYAAYVGVPFVTLAGKSLISRVGKSILSNLGFNQLIALNIDDYVEKIIKLSNDKNLIIKFRKEAPIKFKEISLGNSKNFTEEFERVCKSILLENNASTNYKNKIKLLNQKELLRRSTEVWFSGNKDAAKRILDYTSKNYGDAKSILQLAKLEYHDRNFEKTDQIISLIDISKLCDDTDFVDYFILKIKTKFAINSYIQAEAILIDFFKRNYKISDEQYSEIKLIQSYFNTDTCNKTFNSKLLKIAHLTIHIHNTNKPVESKIFCENNDFINASFFHVAANDRINFINKLLDDKNFDILIIKRENVTIINSNFINEIIESISTASVIGCGGALKWRQKDWSTDCPEIKYWGINRINTFVKDKCTLQIAGNSFNKKINNAQVLDGKILIINLQYQIKSRFDENYLDNTYLAEEEWTNRVAEEGCNLVINRNLGVSIFNNGIQQSDKVNNNINLLRDRLGWKTLAPSIKNYDSLELECESIEKSIECCSNYLI